MDSLLLSSLGSAGLQTAGGIASDLINVNQARINRRFQAGMSSTAHRREVVDLLAAGINPVITGGTRGADTPPGSTANVSNPMEGLSHSASSYIQNRELVQTQRVTRAQIMASTAKLMAERRLTNATTATEAARAANLLQSTKLMTEQEVSHWLENEIKGADVEWMKNQGSGKSINIVKGEQDIALNQLKRALMGGDLELQKWEKTWGQKLKSFSPYVQNIIQALGGAALAKHLFRGKPTPRQPNTTINHNYYGGGGE